MAMNPIPLDGFPRTGRPWNNITPFTYRDGLTYLEVLEALRVWVRDVLTAHINSEMEDFAIDWNQTLNDFQVAVIDSFDQKMAEFDVDAQAFKDAVNSLFDGLRDSLESDVASQLATVNDALASWDATHNAFTANIQDLVDQWTSTQIENNDVITAAILADPESATSEQLSDTIDARISATSAVDLGAVAVGTLAHVPTDMKRAALWGSSTMNGLATHISGLFVGAEVYNAARDGERFEHTLARLGSRQMLAVFPDNEVPASGSVVIESPNVPPSSALRPYTCLVSGVEGSITSTTEDITFTRTTPGDAVPTIATGSPVIPTGSTPFPAFRERFTVLNIGKNNLDGDPLQTRRVIDATVHAAAWLNKSGTPYIVMGHFANTNSSAAHRAAIAQVNMELAGFFGPLFFDLQGYLASSQVWEDSGIAPTPEDTAQQSAKVLPESIATDHAHLNSAGYEAVAIEMERKLLALELFTPAMVVFTSDSFTGADAADIVGRNTDAAHGGSSVEWAGVGSEALAISNGEIVRGAGTPAQWRVGFEVPSADCAVQIKVLARPASGTALFMDLRRQGSSDSADSYRLQIASYNARIAKRVSEVSTTLFDTGYATGDTLQLRVVGDQLMLFINGTLAGMVSDSDVPGAGSVGFSGVNNVSGFALDDFKVLSV